MLEVIIPEDNAELDMQIKALEYAIEHDTREKDRCIHLVAHDKLVKEKIRREANE
ncbi:predicted transcriptional regulator [Clostridium tyrobutyricum DIVETGP]|uniref:Predicted transcriptional regulator n=1 Tax=Clostridium tyrobutyricum DIVETGP TaxID=1408889 RepID=W6NHE2_CLOTY|nr:hypothetical protein [Clostridium tyrobutyricum]AND84233.1 transcriptional regulator [Clostridium tyrobutyricum]AND84317.1 hypothetical protein CTK_C10560 [Clostridium tyrobutyricum]MBV4435469.1 hypothetical protein [Clostridium tyrobutyricum]CDL91517.1 predicted transcriptional regulator [Clostridium tyrobutyricum DIVETGP]